MLLAIPCGPCSGTNPRVDLRHFLLILEGCKKLNDNVQEKKRKVDTTGEEPATEEKKKKKKKKKIEEAEAT